MSVWTTLGIVAIGLAIMMAWTNRDLTDRLDGPAYRTMEYEVLRVEQVRKARTGGQGSDTETRVYIRFIDPFTQQTVESYNTIAEARAPQFHSGERRKGLFAPQWHYPLLDENPPDLEPERKLTRWATLGFAVVGVVLLLFAWKTGRLLS